MVQSMCRKRGEETKHESDAGGWRNEGSGTDEGLLYMNERKVWRRIAWVLAFNEATCFNLATILLRAVGRSWIQAAETIV